MYCSYAQSTRDLLIIGGKMTYSFAVLTGLRELVDYLPATIATIVSCFSAEVSRGLWKYASMNGQDWPSPAANLLTIQGEVKDILAAAGVHISNPNGIAIRTSLTP